MAEERYTTEIHRKIFDNTTGECFNVGPDSDALDLVELSYRPDGNPGAVKSLVFSAEQAKLVGYALISCAMEVPLHE